MSGREKAQALLGALREAATPVGPTAAAGSADKPVKLATIDPAYSGSGSAKVTFDGESTMSAKLYPTTTPLRASDRVALIPQGKGYLIVGVLGGHGPFSWANSTERGAQAGMREGDVGTQRDTSISYRYTSGAWKPWESDWISYSPTFSAASGSGITVDNNSAHYKFASGAMILRLSFRIVSAGTASGILFMTIPGGYTLGNDCSGAGYNVSAGTLGRCVGGSGASIVEMARYDNATFIGAGNFLRCEITLWVQ